MYYLAATIRISLLQDDGGYSLRGGPVDAVIAYGCITTEYCRYDCVYPSHVGVSVLCFL